jgi:hypothetical protein
MEKGHGLRRNRLRFMIALLASCVVLFAFLGWKNSTVRINDPSEFVAEFENKAGFRLESGGYRLAVLPINSDYLRAKRMVSTGKTASVSEVNRILAGSSFAILLLCEPPNGPAGSENDMLNSTMRKGRQAFAERLQLLSNGLAEHAFLRDGSGIETKALTAFYQRTWGIGRGEAALFLFPARPDKGSVFMLNDVGLPIGKIEAVVNPIPRMEFVP